MKLRCKTLKVFLLPMISVSITGCSTAVPEMSLHLSHKMRTPVVSKELQTVNFKEPQTVNFCDLIRDPKLYDNKVVRTQAIAAASFELAHLYDPVCIDKDELTYFECDNEQVLNELDLFLGEFVRDEARRANVTIVGKFEGPNEEGYGHLNGSNFRFVIMGVEDGHPVAPDVAWPWDTE